MARAQLVPLGAAVDVVAVSHHLVLLAFDRFHRQLSARGDDRADGLGFDEEAVVAGDGLDHLETDALGMSSASSCWRRSG